VRRYRVCGGFSDDPVVPFQYGSYP